MSQEVINKNQPSLTEWLKKIGLSKISEEIQEQDNSRADRLEFLYQEIGLPYPRPIIFSGDEVTKKDPRFIQVLEEKGKDLCAIRLVPKEKNLPKLRDRGQSLENCYQNWLLKQEVDLSKYSVQIYPHWENQLWSAIFIVKPTEIFGEIATGAINKLTYGLEQNNSAYFFYDYNKWQWLNYSKEAEQEIAELIKIITVASKETQDSLKRELNIEFSHNIINGYFEAYRTDQNIVFSDFNQVVAKIIEVPDFVQAKNDFGDLKGVSVFPGKAEGNAKIIDINTDDNIDFQDGEILICKTTDIRYLPYMQKAAAILTESGGMLSHAAIAARELKTPCIVGIKDITKKVESGQNIRVNANNGVVTFN